MESSVGPKKKAILSPFELSFLEFCSRKRSFGERISNSDDASYFYKCEFCPGKKLKNEDDLEEHIDSLHTERTCSECGGNFPTRSAFEAHSHGISSQVPKAPREAPKGLFDCRECHQSFPTQFHLSTHIRESAHSLPRYSLPPKKRSGPLKNWPHSRGGSESSSPTEEVVTRLDERIHKEEKQQEKEIKIEIKVSNKEELEKNLESTPNGLSNLIEEVTSKPSNPSIELPILQKPPLEEDIPKKSRQERPDPISEKGNTTITPTNNFNNSSSSSDIPTRRNRTRKNYADIDLYLDESEEEAILQKILRQTSRLKRGRKSKAEYPESIKPLDLSDDLVKGGDSTCSSSSLQLARGGSRKRGRCKKI